MSIISIAVKHLIAAGVTGNALVTAIEEMENSQKPVNSTNAQRQARHRERNKALRNVTNVTSVTSVTNTPPLVPPFDGFPPYPLSLNPPLNPPTVNKTKARARKITLEEVTIDRNSEWLAKKRSEGKYQNHDEKFILEYFVNYCKSNGKTYDDHLSAYRNAFEWDSCQPKIVRGFSSPQSGINSSEKTRGADAYAAIIAERNAKNQGLPR